jgi:dTDP-4-amino-4,6-dideoxygalactose transaminase
MTERRIQIAKPSMGEEEWLALRDPIESGWLTQGPKAAQFEREFAARHGVKHAIACSNCTTAMHLMLVGLGIGPGDEVIVPSFTWVATANVVLYCGATPVLVDVERETFNIDPRLVAAKVTPRTRAIMPVHLFGLCADMDAVAAAAPGIPLFEDAACAAGAGYKNRAAGSLGLAGAFSFHPRKSVTTGEGGMITTDDDALAERMRRARNHGASLSEEERHNGPKPYLLPDFDVMGFNYRMTDLQAAVGLVQFKKLDRFIDERAVWARWYQKELADIPWLRAPQEAQGSRHGWQSFCCYVDPELAPMPRNDIMEYLERRGISTRPGSHAVHMLGYYQNRFGYGDDDFPAARDCYRQSMSIPLHNMMSADDFAYVAEALHEVR